MPLWLALLTYLGVAMRRSLRPLLWPGALMGIQLVNLTLTPLAQEFRFAYGVYLMSWLSLPLLWLILRPDGQTSDHRSARIRGPARLLSETVG